MKDQELLVVLKEHLLRYPKMQPQDVVKLLYQGEFGPGHMIKDPAASLKRLEEEYGLTEHDPTIGVTEDIGNGFVRVNLAALDMGVCSLEKLSALFVLSANQTSGDMNRFQEKLEMIEDRFADLPFEFSRGDIEAYLNDYVAAGCPAVSHSEIYRDAYHPAYRVVKEELIFCNIQIGGEK